MPSIHFRSSFCSPDGSFTFHSICQAQCDVADITVTSDGDYNLQAATGIKYEGEGVM